MTMHKVLYPKDDIDKLYVSRKEEERGRFSLEDCVDSTIKRIQGLPQKEF